MDRAVSSAGTTTVDPTSTPARSSAIDGNSSMCRTCSGPPTFGITIPSSGAAQAASRSSAVVCESVSAIRTKIAGVAGVFAGGNDRIASRTSRRADGSSALGTDASRSKITASAPDASALPKRSDRLPGTKSRLRSGLAAAALLIRVA
jgi:hypothetical protein